VEGKRQFLAAVTRTSNNPFKSSRGAASFGFAINAFVELAADEVAVPGRELEADAGAADSLVFWFGTTCVFRE